MSNTTKYQYTILFNIIAYNFCRPLIVDLNYCIVLLHEIYMYYLKVAKTTFLEVLSLQHVLFASRPRFMNIAFQLEFCCQMIQTFQPENR